MTTELRKQISIFVPLSDWKAIRMEAARRRIPMTELCRRWMRRDIERLHGGTECPAECLDMRHEEDEDCRHERRRGPRDAQCHDAIQ